MAKEPPHKQAVVVALCAGVWLRAVTPGPAGALWFLLRLWLWVGEMSVGITVIAGTGEGHRRRVGSWEHFCQMGSWFLPSKPDRKMRLGAADIPQVLQIPKLLKPE